MIELSANQKRFLNGQTLNYQIVIVLNENIDPIKVERIFKGLVLINDSLRTFFTKKDEVWYQDVSDYDFHLNYYELSENNSINDLINKVVRNFDLLDFPLFSISLIKENSNKCYLLFNFNPIIADARSIEILFNEFERLYNNETKEFDYPKFQYKDFIKWHSDYLSKHEGDLVKINYFKSLIENYSPFEIYSDFPISKFPILINSQSFEIEKCKYDKLEVIAKKNNTSLFNVLFAIVFVFLQKMTGNKNLAVLASFEGRGLDCFKDVIGNFENVLPILCLVDHNTNVSEVIKMVHNNVLEANDNQYYPFTEIEKQIVSEKNSTSNSIYKYIFEFDEINEDQNIIREHKIHKKYPTDYDLKFKVERFTNSINFSFIYNSNLFQPASINNYIFCFENILGQFIDHPNLKVSEYELISFGDKEKILSANRINKNISYKTDDNIVTTFEKTTCEHGHKVAVKVGRSSITYTELNKRVNQLAFLMHNEGIKRNDVVGIIAERSIETIICILATLKAGGSYLPINPDLPIERIDFMLNDSNAKLLLRSDSENIHQKYKTKTIKTSDERLAEMPISNINIDINLHDGAYIIYTSGTTGLPKGVLINHENVLRLLFNDQFQFDFTHRDIWTLFHSFGFDFSVWEMYGALLRGGELVIIRKTESQDTKTFTQIVNKECVTVLNQTPTAFYNLSNECVNSGVRLETIRYVIFGGEELKPKKLSYWHQNYPGTKLINMYGITETTVHVTYKKIEKEEIDSNISNIGKAIPTMSLYVMNEIMQLQPFFVPGELYVGGRGVAMGYINREDLNREKFVINPYYNSEKLYKSGDIGRLLPNGDVLFLGRKDKQVQIRGFRIEIGEIEDRLLSHSEISEVIVIEKDINTDKHLIAYFTSKTQISPEQLRNYLLSFLPDYMIPSYFIQLSNFPMTVNGKIDIRNLPDPSNADYHSSSDYIEPESEIEKQVYLIWEEILNVKNFGINDNFFDLGGNSLSLLYMNDKINRKFDLDIPFVELFEHTTIKSIVENLIINDKVEKVEKDFSEMKDRATTTLNIINKINNDY